MNKKLKRCGTMAAAAALMFGGVAGTLAYLTDSEETVNNFTVGDVTIESLEPNWPGNDDPEPEDLVPNEEIAKDPMIDNKGVNDAVVFMTVDSPIENVTVIADNGEIAEAKGLHEIFWFKDSDDNASTHANKFDSKWTELPTKEMFVQIDGDGKETLVADADLVSKYNAMPQTSKLVKRYVFGYSEPIQGSSVNDSTAQTDLNKKTTSLFDKVQLKNVIEGEIDKAPQEIVIRSYAIQASQILENSADLTDTLNAANLGKIYDVFVRQNSTGNDASGLKIDPAQLRDADSVDKTADGASGKETDHVNRYDTDADLSDNHVKPAEAN